jgi:hypothetical protein
VLGGVDNQRNAMAESFLKVGELAAALVGVGVRGGEFCDLIERLPQLNPAKKEKKGFDPLAE